MANVGNLVIGIKIKRGALDKELQQISRKLSRFGKQMKRTGAELTTGLTLPILALGAGILKTAGDFELGMNQVAAVSGATGTELEKLKDQAKELGATTQFSASEAAAGMNFLAKAGFEAEEILSAMPGTLQLAASAQLDLGTSADIVSNVLQGFNMEVSDLARVNDVLVKAFTSSNTDLVQLGEAMKFAGPVAAGLNQDFEETVAILGAMGNAGIQASLAGTSVRGALVRLATPTKQIQKVLNKLKIETKDAAGNLRPLTDILEDMEKAGIKSADAMTVFGLRAGPGMVALLGQGTAELRKFTSELRDSTGTAARVAAVQMEGFVGGMRALKSAAEGLAIALGESGLLEFTTKWAEKLTSLVRNMTEADAKTMKFWTIVAAGVAALGPVIWILGTLLTSLGAIVGAVGSASTAVVAAWGSISVAVGPLAALIGTSVGAMAAALLLVPAAIVLWITRWEELRDGMIIIGRELHSRMKAFANSTLDSLRQIFTGLTSLIQTEVIDKLGKLIEPLTKWKDDAVAVFQALSDIVVGNSIIPDMVTMIGAQFKKLRENATKEVKLTKDEVTTITRNMKQGVASSIRGMGADLLRGKASVADFVASAAANLAKIGLSSLGMVVGGPIGGALGSVAGDMIGGFFANGGDPPRNKLSVVGENGPEFIRPKSATTVFPMDQLELAGGGGINMKWEQIFQISAFDLSDPGTIRRVMKAIGDRAREGTEPEAIELGRVLQDAANLHSGRAA